MPFLSNPDAVEKTLYYMNKYKMYTAIESLTALLVTYRPRKPWTFASNCYAKALEHNFQEGESLLDILIQSTGQPLPPPLGAETSQDDDESRATTYEATFQTQASAYRAYLSSHQIKQGFATCLAIITSDGRIGTFNEEPGEKALLDQLYILAAKETAGKKK